MSNILVITGHVELGTKKGTDVIEAGTAIDLNEDKRLSKDDVERIITAGAGYMQNETNINDAEQAGDQLSNDRLILYIQAIDKLDLENKDHYTEAGKPEVAALKALIDDKVNATERDIAWTHYQTLVGSE